MISKNPEHIDLRHWKEIVVHSAVSELIASLNFRTIHDSRKIDEILQLNVNQRWKHSDYLAPGWAASGLDPKTEEPTLLGVQYKPDTPPTTADGKIIKYMGAAGEPTQPTFLDNGIPKYWPQVLALLSTAIFLVEGVKKAGCLLTLAYAAVSLPGVWNGQIKGRLKKAIKQLCGLGRPIYLCFDSDQIVKPQVQQALDRLGRLLIAEGCVVFVVVWDSQYKGIDDLCVGAGPETVHEAIANALTFEEWRDQIYQTRDPKAKAKGTALAAQNNGNPGVTFLQQAEAELFGTGRWICFADTLYRWEGTHYQVRTDEAEYPRIKQFADTFGVTKSTLHGTEITYPYARPSSVKQILDWVKQGFCVTTEMVNPAGINCRNGVLELHWEGQQLSVKLINPRSRQTPLFKRTPSHLQSRHRPHGVRTVDEVSGTRASAHLGTNDRRWPRHRHGSQV